MEKNKIIRENLTLSADDFGQSAAANQNITELVRLGKIRRVAVIIDGFVTREELDKIRSLGAKIDIHLTLPDGIRRRRGFLRRSFEFFRMHASKKEDTNKIRKIWGDQIRKFITLSKQAPDGLNSHEYIHFYPPYFRIMIELSDKFGIKHVRYGRKGLLGSFNMVFFIIKRLHNMNKETFASSANISSDYIVSLDWIYPSLRPLDRIGKAKLGTAEKISEFMGNIPEGEIEIICHPERIQEYEIIKNLF